MKVFIALAAFVVAALADQKPIITSYKPEPVYKQTSYKEPEYKSTPPKYNYQYKVIDDYHKVNFGQQEAREGYSTYGEYYVQLPDGRLQTVKYTVADRYSGFVADVSYKGEAKYQPVESSYKPEPKYYKSEPIKYYKPEPKYKSS